MHKKKCQDGDVMEQEYFPKNVKVKSQILIKQANVMDGDVLYVILIFVRNVYSTHKIMRKLIKLQVLEIWINIKMA